MFKNYLLYPVVFITLLLVHIGGSFAATVLETEYYKFYRIKGSYEDVRVDLDYAITGQGIKVNGVSHISDMLNRTGKDIGRTRKVYDHAEAIQFCSATLSRNMMEADPLNIVFCPYIIFIYSLPGEKNTVYMGYRKPPHLNTQKSKKAVADVVKTYEDIIADAQ